MSHCRRRVSRRNRAPSRPCSEAQSAKLATLLFPEEPQSAAPACTKTGVLRTGNADTLSQTFVDLVDAYRRPFVFGGTKLAWRLQLDVRNLFNSDELEVARSDYAGRPYEFLRVTPRQLSLTTALSFQPGQGTLPLRHGSVGRSSRGVTGHAEDRRLLGADLTA